MCAGMGYTTRRWGNVTLALAVALASRTGHAGEPTRADLATARALFSRAERDEEAGRWADALDKLRRTGSIKMTPGIRFHVALCEEKLGQLAAALADYAAAEDSAREEGNQDVIDAVAEPRAEVRARVPTLTLRPPADVKDATLWLDGAPLVSASLGTPLPVEVGSHTIEGRAPNRATFSTTVSLVEKEARSVEVVLPWIPRASATPAAAADRKGPPRSGAIVASSGALALVGFGVAAFFVAGNDQSDAQAQCKELTSCDGLKGPVRTWDALALSGWIVGAGTGALAVYLWTRSPSSDRGASAMLLAGPGSLQIVGRF
jgi:hypothetical protein